MRIVYVMLLVFWVVALPVCAQRKNKAAAPKKVSASSTINIPLEGSNVTTITSKTLDFDYKRSIAVFEKNVTVVDPQLSIYTDKLTVIFDKKENDVRSVTAHGNVRMIQKDAKGKCRMAVYKSSSGEVIMVGEAVLTRPTDSIAADRITFVIKEDGIHSVKAVGNVKLKSVDTGDSKDQMKFIRK